MTPAAQAIDGNDPGLNKRRLRWQCRRSMRELDLMLLRFIDQHYDQLPLAQRDTLEALLHNQDQLLLTWLMGHQQPSDAKQAALVLLIRSTSPTSPRLSEEPD